MKKLLAVLLLLVGTTTEAQQYTSPNLMGSYNLSGTVATDSTGGGYSGGYTPGYNSSTNTILFGYTQSTAAYTYAVNQALQQSGIVFHGYNYSWEYLNQDMSRGSLTASVNFTGINGDNLHTRSWTLGPTTNWTTVSGTETFTNSILTSSLSSFSLSFTGQDDRFWAGFYGPQVRNASLSVNYSFDVCAVNPLSSPTCPGYQQALNQQCSINPLYSSQCSGYTQAIHDQLCLANPLSAADCPGYTVAYYNQQCTLNPLYDRNCPGYAEAYAKKNVLTASTTTTTTAVITSTSDPVSSAAPIVADPTVNSVITSKGTTANADANPAAAVKVTQTAPAATTTAETKSEKKSDSSSSTTNTAENKSADKPKTAREALAEKQREAAKKDAVARAKNLANDMAKAADMEAQVAVQNVVIQAMGYTPGFDSYNKTIPDGAFYRPYEAYPGQRNIDSPSGRGLFGGSDNVHQQMVNSQYNLGN